MYEFQCVNCLTVINEFRKYEDRDRTAVCFFCEHAMKRIFKSAPGQMNVALPDGTKRKGFQELKEAAKLETEAMDNRPEERNRIMKEVNKLKKTKD